MFPQTFRAWHLDRKEKRLLRKQAEIGAKYNVIKNVSTHSMLNDPDGEMINRVLLCLSVYSGELDMKLDLEDIGMCLNKSFDQNILMIEKMTQTELYPVSSSHVSFIITLNMFHIKIALEFEWNTKWH